MGLSRGLAFSVTGWLWADVLLALFAIFAVANTRIPVPPPPVPPDGAVEIFNFNDLDADGRRSSNESGLPGWLFTIGGPEVRAPAQTAANGVLSFRDLTAGSYTVTSIVPIGWKNTDPGGRVPSKTVRIDPGVTTRVSFGGHEIPTPARARGVDRTRHEVIVQTGDLNLLNARGPDLAASQRTFLDRALAALPAQRPVALVLAFGRHASPGAGEELARLATEAFRGSGSLFDDCVVATYHLISGGDSGSAVQLDVYFYNE